MSTTPQMPGNPHAGNAQTQADGLVDWLETEGITDVSMVVAAIHAQALAVLALAHEQRTANLIAWAPEDTLARPSDIRRRLGLGSPDA